MENATTSAVLQVVDLSNLNKFALIYGYLAMVITVFLAGFCIAKILDRKRK